MASNKHLTLKNCIAIEAMLHNKASFKAIADAFDKDSSTISNKIRSHLVSRRVVLCDQQRFHMVNERTIYQLIDSRILSAMNIDLPRIVHCSARRKSIHVEVGRTCRIVRDYDNFTAYMK